MYPLETTVLPSWSLKVVDEQGIGVEGAFVREIWQNYSTETMAHQDDLVSDINGDVVFPRRTTKARILLRVLGPLRNVLLSGVHASFGPDAYVMAFTTQPHREGTESYVPKLPLPGQIVLRPTFAEKRLSLGQ